MRMASAILGGASREERRRPKGRCRRADNISSSSLSCPAHESPLRLPVQRLLSPPSSGTGLAPKSVKLEAALSLLTLPALLTACHRQAPPQPYLAFVVDQASSAVTAVDLGSFQVVTRISVIPRPARIVRRPGAPELYVEAPAGELSVIRFPSLAAENWRVQASPVRSLIFAPDGRFAYAIESPAVILRLNCDRRRIVARWRLDAQVAGAVRCDRLALTPDASTLIAEDTAGSRLIFCDPGQGRVLGVTDVGKDPRDMCLLPDGSKVFVADAGEDRISAVEVARRQLLSHLEIGYPPSYLVAKPDGGEIFALSRQAETLTVVDAFHDSIEQSFTTGTAPEAAVVRPDSTALYWTNSGDGTVSVMDLSSRELLSVTRVGTRPTSLALTPDGRFLAVADTGGGNLAILKADPRELKSPLGNRKARERSALVTAIPVGAEPVDVIIPGWTIGGLK